MPEHRLVDPLILDEDEGPAAGGSGFIRRPPLAASLIAGLGLALIVALVSAEGLWPSRDAFRFQQVLQGDLPGSESVPDAAFVEFERAGCYGTCAVYTVRVAASGDVRFDGERFVCRVGVATQRIDAVAARRLLAALGTVDWRAVNASMALPIPDAEVVRVRLVLGTQVSEARFQPAIQGYAKEVPAVIERVAGLGRWVPTWSLMPPGGPRCAGEDGGPPQVPRWWRNDTIVWDEAG